MEKYSSHWSIKIFSSGIHSISTRIKSGTSALLASLKASDLIGCDSVFFQVNRNRRLSPNCQVLGFFSIGGFSRVLLSHSSPLSLGLLFYLGRGECIWGQEWEQNHLMVLNSLLTDYSWFHILLLVHIWHIQTK